MDRRFFVFLVTPQHAPDQHELRALSKEVAKQVRVHGELVDCGTNVTAGRVEGHCMLSVHKKNSLSEALHALGGVHSVGIMEEGEERHADECILR